MSEIWVVADMISQAAYDQLITELSPTTLVAVSKMQPLERVQQCYDYGHRDFGENRVQNLVQRHEDLPADIRWHLIGQLQRNKVKYIAPFVHMIHSVDSWKLLIEIDKQAEKCGRIIPFLFQIKIAEEDTKSGYDISELLSDLSKHNLATLQSVECHGVMGMASFTEDLAQIKREFLLLTDHFEELGNRHLTERSHFTQISMGMSGDYRLAIECGSTMVRIGSGVFGARNY